MKFTALLHHLTVEFYVRIEEPRAITLDRYAEFLGTTGIDHELGAKKEIKIAA